MPATRENGRRLKRNEILKAEWIALVGESLVAVGSVIVVIGLIRAFAILSKED
jgi:hypothetical protein